MADTWSVFIVAEGPEAEEMVRALIDQARDDAEVSFVMGGPGTPDWDLGAPYDPPTLRLWPATATPRALSTPCTCAPPCTKRR